MKRSSSLLLSLCLTLGMLSTAAQATEWHNPIDSAAVSALIIANEASITPTV